MTTKTQSTTERLRETLKTVRDIAAKAQDEGRDLSAEERETIQTHMAKAATLKADASLEQAVAGLEDDLAIIEGKRSPGATIEAAGTRISTGERKSLGGAFIESEPIQAYLKGVAPSGGISRETRVSTPPVGFDGLKAFGYRPGTGRPKALITGVSDTSAGALVDNDFLGLVDEGTYARPLTMLDVVTRGQTGSDTVEYVRVNTVTNAAAPVAEATTTSDGLKPESAMTLEKVSETVKTIAHWLPATKRALSDAAQIRTLIDSFLRYGLFEELEDQIINGDGTGENFTGLLNVTGIQDLAFDTDLLTTSRKAKTLVRTNGRAMATAYALHPNDAERLDLLKDSNGTFYFGGPADDGVQRLWRLPVVESEAIPEGIGIVGDWRRAVIWDREQAAITATDSHADFFVRNIIAILAELRAAFGVLRPAAFVRFGVSAGATA